jgi:hypothetical protein
MAGGAHKACDTVKYPRRACSPDRIKKILSLPFTVAAGRYPIGQCGEPTGWSGKFLLLAMNRSHSYLAAGQPFRMAPT